MSDATSDRSAAYQEAAIELGKGIAIGLVPFLGQAIDAYDTIESAIALYRAKDDTQKENAQFDLLLAIVGWIPGPGDGVKKSLRIVNRDPERFAPVLFDLLRFVLSECGIKTSPEALLDGIFDAGKLASQIDEIVKGVKDSSAFQALPEWMQNVVVGTLTQARATMPLLVGVVQKRLIKWKRKQHNSSAHNQPHAERDKKPLPKARDGNTAARGDSRATHTHANGTTRDRIAQESIAKLTNEMAGISGEHIADYYCFQQFGWGAWTAHDQGTDGRFAVKPDAKNIGKLSRGGSPKSWHKLYKLSDGANGTGIDAVWHAKGHNQGKTYAIVEAKATRDEDAGKFNRYVTKGRKPGIASTLGKNVIKEAFEIIEPIEEAASSSTPKSAGKRGGKQSAGARGAARKQEQATTAPTRRKVEDVYVQMSHEWIEKNVVASVGKELRNVVLSSYSRHLFYSPAYLPQALVHMKAKLAGLPQQEHSIHDAAAAIHYNDGEVKAAVNKRKASLRKKHGNLASLRAE